MRTLILLLAATACDSKPVPPTPEPTWHFSFPDPSRTWHSLDVMCDPVRAPMPTPPSDSSQCQPASCVGRGELKMVCGEWTVRIFDVPSNVRGAGKGLGLDVQSTYPGQGRPDYDSCDLNLDHEPMHPVECSGTCQIQYQGVAKSKTLTETPCAAIQP